MARFMMGEEDRYGNSGNSNYFALKEDGEVKKVRFMYKDSNDVVGYATHEVLINGKKRYVNCIREYNDPIDNCPLCKAGYRQIAKMYVPIYEVDTGNVSVWERGRNFMSRMSSICARYPNVVSHLFEIERHGAKGSTDTTYEIFEVGNDNTQLEDLPETPQILGKALLDKNADEMNAYLKNGEFPSNSVPQRQQQTQTYASAVPQRRVPADTNGSERF